ncbi:peptidylprolyl isomerase [uncultured Ilyobacter sp.]|uniref:FKBP-type peptidyl-prolyl cis-trans isomerase n=1 Tax=uncultured Ilyobacter sp. TaxID=544433 RepID=UPI0029C6D39C|nr:peptidylprolyl isomerase [uncultured Ilyobacter sp.]
MKIEESKVVVLDFILTDEDGNILEDTKEVGPFAYIQGFGDFIPKIEEILEGKTEGFQSKIIVSPEEGYGEYDEELISEMSKEDFSEFDDIYEGLDFQAETDEGLMEFVIKSIEDDVVLVDGNHPFAGKNLTFDLKVTEVRDASEEELEHGHVHF